MVLKAGNQDNSPCWKVVVVFKGVITQRHVAQDADAPTMPTAQET